MIYENFLVVMSLSSETDYWFILLSEYVNYFVLLFRLFVLCQSCIMIIKILLCMICSYQYIYLTIKIHVYINYPLNNKAHWYYAFKRHLKYKCLLCTNQVFIGSSVKNLWFKASAAEILLVGRKVNIFWKQKWIKIRHFIGC